MSHPLDYFSYKNKVLHADGVSVPELIQKHGSPLYIYSAQAFLSAVREFQEGLQSIRHLLCFAVKSNSNIAILKLLGEAGVGMDLVSGGELFRTLRAGVPPDRIVFSGVGKTRDEMRQAAKSNIYSFNVESVPELQTLNEVALETGIKVRVALRFNPDVNAKTHPYISTGLKKNKFGMNRTEIFLIAKELKKYSGIELKGISIHIGSQLLSLAPLRDAFDRLRDLVDQLNFVLKTPLEFVDVGGGVGITYKSERPPSIAQYCKWVTKIFKDVRVLLEPGRIIAGNSGILVSQVLYRKPRGDKDFLIIDAGMNDLMRPALYGSYHEIIPVLEKHRNGSQKDPMKKTDIVGPVCESTDCFASNRNFPTSVESGDLVAILSTGAYGFTMSSTYNTRPRPAEILIENGSARVIRERETYESLIKGERL